MSLVSSGLIGVSVGGSDIEPSLVHDNESSFDSTSDTVASGLMSSSLGSSLSADSGVSDQSSDSASWRDFVSSVSSCDIDSWSICGDLTTSDSSRIIFFLLFLRKK